MQRLGVAKGPSVGLLMEEQIRWQLRNRDGDAEACCAYLRQQLPLLLSPSADSSSESGAAKRTGEQHKRSRESETVS